MPVCQSLDDLIRPLTPELREEASCRYYAAMQHAGYNMAWITTQPYQITHGIFPTLEQLYHFTNYPGIVLVDNTLHFIPVVDPTSRSPRLPTPHAFELLHNQLVPYLQLAVTLKQQSTIVEILRYPEIDARTLINPSQRPAINDPSYVRTDYDDNHWATPCQVPDIYTGSPNPQNPHNFTPHLPTSTPPTTVTWLAYFFYTRSAPLPPQEIVNLCQTSDPGDDFDTEPQTHFCRNVALSISPHVPPQVIDDILSHTQHFFDAVLRDDDYSSFIRLNKRNPSKTILMPVQVAHVPRVLYLLDISGSMRELLGPALSVTNAVISEFRHDVQPYLGCANTGIHSIHQAHLLTEQVTIPSGGGTDMLRALYQAFRSDIAPDGVILITDCATRWSDTTIRNRILAYRVPVLVLATNATPTSIAQCPFDLLSLHIRAHSDDLNVEVNGFYPAHDIELV